MPSSATITSFYNFSANTKARASQVNNNFDVIRGHFIPIHPSTATSANNTYDLGSSDHAWRNGYFQSLTVSNPIFPMTTTANLSTLNLSSFNYNATTGVVILSVVAGLTATCQITFNGTRNIEIGFMYNNTTSSRVLATNSTSTASDLSFGIRLYRDNTTTLVGANTIYFDMTGNSSQNVSLDNFKFMDINLSSGTYNYTYYYDTGAFVGSTGTSIQMSDVKMYARVF